MINNTSINFDGVEMDIEYDYYPGKAGSRSMKDEPAICEVTGIEIKNGTYQKPVSIMELLSEKVLRQIEDQVSEEVSDYAADYSNECDYRYELMRDQMAEDAMDRDPPIREQ